MGIFSKKGKGDTIDFTYLQKRGLLPPPKHRYTAKLPTSSDGVVDFRNIASSESSTSTQTSSSSSDSGAFGFLANMASAATPAETQKPAETSFPSIEGFDTSGDPIKAARRARLAEFNSMKVKLEDLEYKLERSLERIAQLESQLSELRR